MVGTASAIDPNRAAKLGGNHNCRIGPYRAKPDAQGFNSIIQSFQSVSQLALSATLIGVGVPAFKRQDSTSWTTWCCQNARGSAGQRSVGTLSTAACVTAYHGPTISNSVGFNRHR